MNPNAVVSATAASALLIVADSERNADMLYATGLFVPDPFIYLKNNRTVHLVLSDLEMDRAAKHLPDATIHSFSKLREQTAQSGIPNPNIGHLAGQLLNDLGLSQVRVPANFPFGIAEIIRETWSNISLLPDRPFPERAVKSPAEVRKIQQILRLTQEGLRAGVSLIRNAEIKKDGQLWHQGCPLTSEKVRAAIHTTIGSLGGLPGNTIVAGGDQACDPHERGSGPLKAHLPIIIDVFPRAEATGYFGDLTRTVVKGRASESVRRIYQSVLQAQQTALNAIRAGEKARKVHEAIQSDFESSGYKTERRNHHMQGFFHGTGHGLGLELHEAPNIGKSSLDTFQTGNVVTVEPGLYYSGIGGVRIEDVALIQEGGRPLALTDFEKTLEL